MCNSFSFCFFIRSDMGTRLRGSLANLSSESGGRVCGYLAVKETDSAQFSGDIHCLCCGAQLQFTRVRHYCDCCHFVAILPVCSVFV
jgi:hypothetical protein